MSEIVNHTIHHVVIDMETIGQTNNLIIHETMRKQFIDKMVPFMDDVFKKYSDEDDVLSIDELCIDLGDIRSEYISRQFEEKFYHRFIQIFGEIVEQRKKHQDNNNASNSTQEISSTSLDNANSELFKVINFDKKHKKIVPHRGSEEHHINSSRSGSEVGEGQEVVPNERLGKKYDPKKAVIGDESNEKTKLLRIEKESVKKLYASDVSNDDHIHLSVKDSRLLSVSVKADIELGIDKDVLGKTIQWHGIEKEYRKDEGPISSCFSEAQVGENKAGEILAVENQIVENQELLPVKDLPESDDLRQIENIETYNLLGVKKGFGEEIKLSHLREDSPKDRCILIASVKDEIKPYIAKSKEFLDKIVECLRVGKGYREFDIDKITCYQGEIADLKVGVTHIEKSSHNKIDCSNEVNITSANNTYYYPDDCNYSNKDVIAIINHHLNICMSLLNKRLSFILRPIVHNHDHKSASTDRVNNEKWNDSISAVYKVSQIFERIVKSVDVLIKKESNKNRNSSISKNNIHSHLKEIEVMLTASYLSNGEKNNLQSLSYYLRQLSEIFSDPDMEERSKETVSNSHYLSAYVAKNAKRKDAHGDATHYMISNSGIVLLWPYLRNLFSSLGLTDGNSFASLGNSYTAVLLLHYITSGKKNIAYYDGLNNQILFNKFLCGIEQHSECPEIIALVDEQTDKCDRLLQAVLTHWSVSGVNSIPSLRELFLKRNAELIYTPYSEQWLLDVEPKPYDVLLNKMPWEINRIKLPWMTSMLDVKWSH